MLVRHFMTLDPIVLTPEQTCRDALRTLRKHRIRRGPVVQADQLVGIVSERDLLRILPGTAGLASSEAGETSMDMPVKQIMKKDVKTLQPNDHLEAAARLMLQYKIGGIPVVEKGKLRGIITESDIFKALWKILTSGKGCRIVFEVAQSAQAESIDYLALCAEHGCRVHGFLRFPRPRGGDMCYISVEGQDVEGLIDAIWATSCQVISVEGGPRRIRKEKND